jgi:hypothetical protein
MDYESAAVVEPVAVAVRPLSRRLLAILGWRFHPGIPHLRHHFTRLLQTLP